MPKISPYPLTWPVGRKRTPHVMRRQSRFKPITRNQAWADLFTELDRFFARGSVITTNAQVRHDNMPYAGGAAPKDPGVAVYFDRDRHYAISCDTYLKVEENVRALTVTIDALRRIDRHGCGELLEQALSGFAELPPAGSSDKWWVLLGFTGPPEDYDIAMKRLRKFQQNNHTDHGGYADTFLKLTEAKRQLKAYYVTTGSE